jgi:type IV pilus assembly protein PilC
MRPLFPTFRRAFNTVWPWWTSTAQQQSLLRLIAVAVEENLPLVPLLEAWAQDERGVQKRRLHSVLQLLSSGILLPDAFEAVTGALRDEDVLAIRFGAQSGTLAASLRQALENSTPLLSVHPSRFRHALEYFLTIGVIGSLIVAFIQIKVAPSMHKVVEDFGMLPPPIVHLSWSLFDTIAHYWYILVLAFFALLWLTFSPRPGRVLRRTFLGRLLFPLRELRSAEILQQLGTTTAAGRPISSALSTLARYHFDPAVRRKLLFVRNEAEQGADVWQSMAAAGLVSPAEVRLLRTADQIGNRPWALRQLAAVKKRRTERRLDRLSEFVLPVFVLTLGAFVLLQALAVFAPLTKFVSALAR